MEFFTKNSIIKKIIISILIVLVIIFSIPRATYAAGWSLAGTLLKELLQLIASVGDIAMGLLNNVMLGADGVGSAMLPKGDPNLTNKESWIYAGKYSDSKKYNKLFNAGEEGDGNINTNSLLSGTAYEIPNMLYSPENIFANNIAALDVNFLRQNTYKAITNEEDAKAKAKSSAGELRETISSWYVSFRNIAIVGLLSVLIYIGIKILISSTASDKAKYKENLKDWFMALCLVFIIHFIMSGILMLTDKVTELFATKINDGITIGVKGDKIAFKTNLTGYVRFRSQSSDAEEVTAYTIVYMILVFYTIRFTIIYFKRFLYMAFFTMIAPLVALTYPIDKMGDGKAQAFNIWFKEYTMNAIIQPVHLILYTVFVSSAMDLATNNIIYAIVAIGFLIPAEKFIKKMFKLDQASSPSGLGSFAGGALAMKGLEKLGAMAEGKNSGQKGSSNSQDSSSKKTKIKMQDRRTLGSFGGESSDNSDSSNQNEDIRSDSHDVLDNEPIQGEEDENPSDVRSNNVFGGQEEMDRLGAELDQYDDNDIYMNPELGEKQRRYQELDAEKSQWEEEQAQQEAERIRLENEKANQEDAPQFGDDSQQQQSNDNMVNSQQEIPGWKRRVAKNIAIKGFKTLGKGIYKGTKLGLKTAAVAAGVVVGTAAGAATGEGVGKTLQYASMGGAIGKKMGNVVNRLPENPYRSALNAKDAISDKINGVKSSIDEERYGVGYAKQQEALANNAVAKREFMRDKQEEKKYKEMAGRIYQKTGKDYSVKDLMNASFDYQQAGITDEEEIEKGLALEAKHGGINGENHNKMIDVIDFSTKYKRDSFTDSKKLAGLEGDVQSRVNSEKSQLEVMNLLAEKYGVSDYYKKVGTIGKHNNSHEQSSRQNNAGSRQTGPQNNSRGGQPGLQGNARGINSGPQQNNSGGDKPGPQNGARRGRPRKS